jgi:hypothetical protein
MPSFPFCFSLLLVPPSARKESINGPGGTVIDLFRFVASFGRDKGHCLPKQGDSRTILWPRLWRASPSVHHVWARPDAAVVPLEAAARVYK